MTTPADLASTDTMKEVNVPVSNVEQQNKGEMLACVFKGKEKLEMKTVPKPEVTDPEDAIVRITGTTGKVYWYTTWVKKKRIF